MTGASLVLLVALAGPVAAQAPAVGPGAVVGTQSTWQDLVRFSDQPNAFLNDRNYKAWQAAEKQVVLRHLDWIMRNQPGLWSRATAFGPLTLHRADLSRDRVGTHATAYRTTLVFQDSFFPIAARPVNLFDQGLLITVHELIHVADLELTLSTRPEWRAAVERAIADYRAQAPALTTEADRARLSLRLGIVFGYTAENLTEALAELGSYAALEPSMRPGDWSRLNMKADALDFLRREVLSAPSGHGAGAQMLAALRHRDAGRAREAYDAYTGVLGRAPQTELPLIRRALLSLSDASLPATALADVAAARPLISDYSKSVQHFALAATEAGLKAGRHGEVLSDCADASRRGVDVGSVHMNCGRSRMMDTLSRTIRRQMTPEETRQGYEAALSDLRRAKAREPGLSPTIEPLERQLEALLAPKTAA